MTNEYVQRGAEWLANHASPETHKQLVADVLRASGALSRIEELEQELARFPTGYKQGHWVHHDEVVAMEKRVEEQRVEVESLTAGLEDYAQRWYDEMSRANGLQEAIDEVASTLHSSAHVGGPSERDAWRRVLEIVGPLEIQKTQAGAVLSQAQQSQKEAE